MKKLLSFISLMSLSVTSASVTLNVISCKEEDTSLNHYNPNNIDSVSFEDLHNAKVSDYFDLSSKWKYTSEDSGEEKEMTLGEYFGNYDNLWDTFVIGKCASVEVKDDKSATISYNDDQYFDNCYALFMFAKHSPGPTYDFSSIKKGDKWDQQVINKLYYVIFKIQKNSDNNVTLNLDENNKMQFSIDGESSSVGSQWYDLNKIDDKTINNSNPTSADILESLKSKLDDNSLQEDYFEMGDINNNSLTIKGLIYLYNEVTFSLESQF